MLMLAAIRIAIVIVPAYLVQVFSCLHCWHLRKQPCLYWPVVLVRVVMGVIPPDLLLGLDVQLLHRPGLLRRD
jgi:hypothetical protein